MGARVGDDVRKFSFPKIASRNYTTDYHFVRTINFEGGHVGDDIRKFSFPKSARTTEIT